MSDLIELLKSSRVFASLNDSARANLLGKCTQVTLPHGEVLFYQGDPSDTIFILIHGKLAAELTFASGDSRIVGHIDVGETVGEVGALSNEPRSLTVKALKDCLLLKMQSKDFIEICHQYPAVMFATLHPIIERSQGLLQIISSERTSKHIVIVPANKEVNLAVFAAKLMELAKSFPNLLTVSDYQAEFSNLNVTVDSTKEKIALLAQQKKPSHRTLYILSTFDTPLARVAFKRADVVYIAALSSSPLKIDHHVLDKTNSRYLHLRSLPNLILIHSEGTLAPKNTANWLNLTPFEMYHHVRIDAARDFQRLLRFIRGKAVGVVLSGGGTRGWSHLGAIKALREAKIPIDMIGGTSVGAIVAACYAMSLSFEEAYDKFYKVVVGSSHSVSWRNLTWPIVSLFNAKNFTETQMTVFDQVNIEDLWIPFYCVSCNLATTSEVTHRRGLLWERLRASASIPGLIPPMLIDGEIHLDGGLLNNLPVDVMRQYLGPKAKIIAIELNSFAPQRHKYHFPPILTFKDAICAKLGIGGNRYKFPRFVEVFLRGLFVGSVARAKQNSLAANVFVSLNLGRFRILKSNPEEAERLIKIGYDEAHKQIYQDTKASVSVEAK